jgi:hypothetical protein
LSMKRERAFLSSTAGCSSNDADESLSLSPIAS